MTKTPVPHFFQSEAWALFQEVLGKQVIQRSGKGWSYSAVVEQGDGRVGRIFTRLYCPYGPYAKDEQSLASALQDLESQAKKCGADYVRVEPTLGDAALPTLSYKKMKHAFQPELTLIIDLDRPFEEVQKDMSKTNRYLYKHAARDGMTFSVSYEQKDIEDFWAMMVEMRDRTKTIIRPKKYFTALLETLGPKKQAAVAYGYHDSEVVVAIIFVDDPISKTRFYMYAGSNDKARKVSANSSLLSFVIDDAHQKGYKHFDMYGVSPADQPNHKWAGFSKFKRSFGGEELAYCGTWEKPIKKVRYHAMSAARKLAR